MHVYVRVCADLSRTLLACRRSLSRAAFASGSSSSSSADEQLLRTDIRKTLCRFFRALSTNYGTGHPLIKMDTFRCMDVLSKSVRIIRVHRLRVFRDVFRWHHTFYFVLQINSQWKDQLNGFYSVTSSEKTWIRFQSTINIFIMRFI